MYKVAIVDDESAMRKCLTQYIESYMAEKGCMIQISVFETAADFLRDYKPIYDIVFMDIDMPRINGIAAARKLREIDRRILLIFVTNLAQYALKGYEVDALDYVVKPIRYSKFVVKFERAIERIPEKVNKTLIIKSEDGVIYVNLKDIIFVEVQGHDVFYHTAEHVYRVRGTMTQVMENIVEENFCLCNRCYYVNLNHVEKVTGNIVVVGKTEIQVSRGRKKAFMDALAAFYNGGADK